MDQGRNVSALLGGAIACLDACRYLAALLIGALSGCGKKEILSSRYTLVPGYWDRNPLVAEIDEIACGSFKPKNPPEIQGSGYVVRSLEAALWSFYRRIVPRRRLRLRSYLELLNL